MAFEDAVMRRQIPRGIGLAGLIWVLFIEFTVLAAPATTDPRAVPPSAAEQIRKQLDQPVTAEFANQPLQEALAQLSLQVKLRFVLDRTVIALMPIADPDMPVAGKFQDVKLRTVLRTIAGQYNLTFVQVQDMVLVTTEEMGLYRQMRQRINVDLNQVPLHQALQQLGRSTAANLVLDPRAAKEARSAPLTLQLDDVPLETAVRLMAEMAGLKVVRLGNVLFVTTEDRAEKLRAEPESRSPLAPGVMPDGTVPGGFGIAPAVVPPVRIQPNGNGGAVPPQPGIPPDAPPNP
jgi:hypothetical protein